jgi:hypothetical protein
LDAGRSGDRASSSARSGAVWGVDLKSVAQSALFTALKHSAANSSRILPGFAAIVLAH